MSVLNEPITGDDPEQFTCHNLFNKIASSLKQVFTWKILKPVLYGQGLSILICGTAITSTYLSNAGISVPLTQSFINYILLCLVYTSMLCFTRDEFGKPKIIKILRDSWWKYLLLGIVDVEANFMVVLAYQYTSLTSVQLLDCFVIPVVMLLSYFLLKVRYVHVHFIGVVVAMVGVACMVGADVLVGREGTGEAGRNPVLGDLLVLGSAVLYGISNVSMEFISKRRVGGNVEFLGMYGLFGPIVCGTQVAILERNNLASISWNSQIILLLAGFGLCMFLLYSLMPIVMRLSSATAVNISLLTADLYALFAGLFLFKDKLSGLYIVSFITIVVALVVYNSRPPISRRTVTPDQEIDDSSVSDASIPEDAPLSVQNGTWFSNAIKTHF